MNLISTLLTKMIIEMGSCLKIQPKNLTQSHKSVEDKTSISLIRFLGTRLSVGLLLIIIHFGLISKAQAQCQTNLGSISVGTSTGYYSFGQLGYLSFNAIAGCQYNFSYCFNGGYSGGDPMLAITDVNFSFVASNDDYCGLGSHITWTAPSSGTYRIHSANYQTGWSCGSPYSTYYMAYWTTNSCVTTPPGCVTSGFSPADLSTNINGAGSLSWNAATNATSYDVYLGTTNPPTTLVSNVSSTNYSFSGLTANTVYYWRIIPRNGAGAATGTCTVNSFTTGTIPACVTSGISPANGSNNISASSTLSWTAVTGAVSYDVYLGTTNPPTTLVSNVTNPSYTYSGLSYTTSYYWRIIPRNSFGTSTGSCRIDSFITTCAPLTVGNPNGAGGTFTYVCGATNQQIALAACESVYGTGNCTTGSCGSFTYYYNRNVVSCDCNKPVGQYEFIYSNTGYNGVGDDYGGASTSVTGNSLFVRVKSSSGCNSNSWNLSLSNLAGSGCGGGGVRLARAPIQVCPGTQIGLRVTPLTGATGYTWSVPSGYTIVNGQTTDTITVIADTTRGFIRVTPYNTCSTGGRDSVLYAATRGLTPINGATNVGASGSLSWTVTNIATSYDVYLGTTNPPTTLVGNVSSNTYNFSGLSPLTTYFWRIIPRNNLGQNAGTCFIDSFSTGTRPGCVIAGITPANGSNNISASSTLSWTAVTDATSYDVYLGTTNPPTTLVNNVTNPSYTYSGLSYTTTYYWRVIPRNSFGASTGTCRIDSFVTTCAPLTVGNPNGAGGTFTYACGATNQQIALAACESVYGVGNCTTGSCGAFYYYYNSSSIQCDCSKPIGQYEFIYLNTGYSGVGQDYGGASTNVSGNSLFVRRKGSNTCDQNSWSLALSNLAGSGCGGGGARITTQPPVVCQGSLIGLRVAPITGASGYTWSVPSGYTIVNGQNTDTITVRADTARGHIRVTPYNSCSTAGSDSVAYAANPVPAAPVAPGAAICGSGTISLTASGSSGSYSWWTSSTGGTQVGTGANFITPVLSNTTTYFVQGNGSSGSFNNLTPTSSSFYYDQNIAGLTGDDRGGMAITPNYVYLTGDNNTARFDANTLANGTSFTRRDGLFSDLSNGNLWTLWDGNTDPISWNTSSYNVTSVRSLNTDMTLGASTISLSSSINLDLNAGNCGIYAGSGFVIIKDQNNVFRRIDLSSGLVTNLGTYSISPQNTESWAHWGVAEFCSDYRILFKGTSNSTDISRLNLTSGQTTTAASLSGSLSDLASFTYSPWNQRWYYHYEGNGMFGGSDEGIGYANASASACGSSCNSGRTPVVATVTPLPLTPTLSGNQTIYVSQSTTLTASGSTGTYSWWTQAFGGTQIGTGNTLNTGSLTQVGTYTYYAEASANNCISGRDSAVVTVLLVTYPAPQSNSPICEGSTLQISAPTAINATYAWAGPNGFTSSSQYPTIPNATSVTQGWYYMSIYVPNQMVYRDSLYFTVNPLPATPSISGTQTIYQNQTTTLTASGSTGSYSWWDLSIGGTQLGTGSTYGTQPLLANTTFYVEAINSFGCISVRGSVLITVLSPILTNSPVCEGSSLYMSGPATQGASYTWSGPNGFSFAGQYPSIFNMALSQQGWYYMSMYVPNQAVYVDSVFNSVGAAIGGLQAAGNSPFCSGSTIALSVPAGLQGAIYTWTGPNGFSSSLAQPTIPSATTINQGLYSVTISSPGCVTQFRTYNMLILNTSVVQIGGNSPVCEGTTLILTASSARGITYSWSGPNGFTSTLQNISINPALLSHTGVYSLVTSAPGCSSSLDTVSIVVNARGGTFTSNSPVCFGSNLNLSATAPYQQATFNWAGPNGYTSTQAFPILTSVTPTESGVYTGTVNIPGCPSVQSFVAVSISSTNTVGTQGNTPICQGGTLQLEASLVNGATYSWSGPNQYASSLRTPSFTNVQPNLSGGYTVSATIPGCGVVSSVISVNVNAPGGTFASNSPICQGSTLNLSSTANSNAAVYSWSGPNGFTSNQDSPSIPNTTTSESGVYSATLTIPGCPTVYASLPVTITGAQTIAATGNTPLCVGDNLQLGANLITGATYSWTGPNGFSSTQRTPPIGNVQIPQSGDYIVTAIVPGCGTILDTLPVLVNAPGGTFLSNSPVCAGSSLALSSSANSNQATFVWAGPNGFTSTQQYPTVSLVTVNDAGNYTGTVNIPGCPSVFTVLPVQVSGTNTVGAIANTPICEGGTLQLEASLVNGATYSWSGPNGFTSNLRTPPIANVQIGQAGNYVVTANIPGCGTTTAAVSVVVGRNTTGVTVSTNSPVCVGSSLGLFVSAPIGYTYSWSGPNGFTSSSAQPSIGNVSTGNIGVYTLIVSSVGCSSNTLNTSPVSVISTTLTATGNTPICVGNTLQLSANPISGATYSWSGPNGYSSNLLAPSIINVQSSTSGTYILMANAPGCGILTSTVAISVAANPNSIAVATNVPVCEGGSLNLYASPTVGFTYNWSGPNGFTSNQAQPQITPVSLAASGEYTLIASVPGCSNAVIRTLTLLITPSGLSTTVNTPICQGATLNLSATLINNATYRWTAPDGFTSSLRTTSRLSAQPSMLGVYTLTVNSPGCGVLTSFVSATIGRVTTGVTVSNISICAGNPLPLTCSSPTGFTYSWTGPSGFTSAIASPTINPAGTINSGNYNLTVSSTGCSPSTRTLIATVNSAAAFGVSSNSPICQNANLILNSVMIPNATYSWSGPGGWVATGRSASRTAVNPTMSGVYAVVMTLPGCGTTTGTVSVAIGHTTNTTTAVLNSPICINNTLNLSAVGQQSTHTYSWTGPAGFTSALGNPSISNAQNIHAGEYTLNVTSPGCPPSTTMTGVDAVVNDPASLTVSASGVNFCANQAVSFTASSIPSTSYSWTGPNGFTVNTRLASRNPLAVGHTGIYTLTANIGGCGITTRSVAITVTNCRTAQEEATTTLTPTENTGFSFNAWPNPNTGTEVTLEWKGLTTLDATITVKVYDNLGRTVMVKSVDRSSTENTWRDSLIFPQTLSKGQYVIETIVGGEREYVKMIVE